MIGKTINIFAGMHRLFCAMSNCSRSRTLALNHHHRHHQHAIISMSVRTMLLIIPIRFQQTRWTSTTAACCTTLLINSMNASTCQRLLTATKYYVHHWITAPRMRSIGKSKLHVLVSHCVWAREYRCQTLRSGAEFRLLALWQLWQNAVLIRCRAQMQDSFLFAVECGDRICVNVWFTIRP